MIEASETGYAETRAEMEIRMYMQGGKISEPPKLLKYVIF